MVKHYKLNKPGSSHGYWRRSEPFAARSESGLADSVPFGPTLRSRMAEVESLLLADPHAEIAGRGAPDCAVDDSGADHQRFENPRAVSPPLLPKSNGFSDPTSCCHITC